MKINNLKKVPATGKIDDKFIGIKINENKIEFHYPETFDLSTDDDTLRNEILSVIRTISLAKTTTKDMSSYNTHHKNDDVFPLGAYLWIINDYLTFGRYENREKRYIRGNGGRINWKRTMRSNPIVSEGNIIYSDIISEKREQKDNLLTEIYNFCVQKSVDAIGWLYGVTFDANGVDYYRLFNYKKYISVLNSEMSHVFDDKKRTRLQNMKNVITGLDDSVINTREIVYGVDSYEYVYERMVDSMFSNIQNIKEFYPSATWDMVLETKPVKSSNLRPDTIMVKDKKVYILDAKYYRYGTTFKTKDMPETTSVQKQITYGEFVKKVKAGMYEDVYSAFILPYSKTQNEHKDKFNEDMVFVGIGEADWIEQDETSSRKVVAILLDTKFLIENWTRKNDDNMNQLISLIEKNIAGVERNN